MAVGQRSASCRALRATNGVETVREMVKARLERGVEFLTLFAFSSENWRRPAEEVSLLMQLFVKASNRKSRSSTKATGALADRRRYQPVRSQTAS